MTDSNFIMKNIRRDWLYVVLITLIVLFLLLRLTVDDQFATIEKKNSSSGKKFHLLKTVLAIAELNPNQLANHTSGVPASDSLRRFVLHIGPASKSRGVLEFSFNISNIVRSILFNTNLRDGHVNDPERNKKPIV